MKQCYDEKKGPVIYVVISHFIAMNKTTRWNAWQTEQEKYTRFMSREDGEGEKAILAEIVVYV